MEYLLGWRMTVAKDLLRNHELGVTEVARRVGYGSASAFSIAFSRQVGQPPSRFARLGGVSDADRKKRQFRVAGMGEQTDSSRRSPQRTSHSPRVANSHDK